LNAGARPRHPHLESRQTQRRPPPPDCESTGKTGEKNSG